MNDGRARHIGDIIKDRNSRVAHHLVAAPDRKRNLTSAILKVLHALVHAVLDVLAAIGWFITLPFVAHDKRALPTPEQSRG